MTATASQVLLVEDDPALPEVLRVLLHEANINLLSARTVESALEIARKQKADLILLDLGLPGADGFELLRRIKSFPETASIPVIVLTAWNDRRQIARFRAGRGRLRHQTI